MAEDKEVLGRFTGSISLSMAVDATVVFLSAEGAKECSLGFYARSDHRSKVKRFRRAFSA
jgi:hypothetical protein